MDPSFLSHVVSNSECENKPGQSRIVKICQEKNKCILTGLVTVLCFLQFYFVAVYNTTDSPQIGVFLEAIKNLTRNV